MCTQINAIYLRETLQKLWKIYWLSIYLYNDMLNIRIARMFEKLTIWTGLYLLHKNIFLAFLLTTPSCCCCKQFNLHNMPWMSERDTFVSSIDLLFLELTLSWRNLVWVNCCFVFHTPRDINWCHDRISSDYPRGVFLTTVCR